jgi:hypothetical protein
MPVGFWTAWTVWTGLFFFLIEKDIRAFLGMCLVHINRLRTAVIEIFISRGDGMVQACETAGIWLDGNQVAKQIGLTVEPQSRPNRPSRP